MSDEDFIKLKKRINVILKERKGKQYAMAIKEVGKELINYGEVKEKPDYIFVGNVLNTKAAGILFAESEFFKEVIPIKISTDGIKPADILKLLDEIVTTTLNLEANKEYEKLYKLLVRYDRELSLG